MKPGLATKSWWDLRMSLLSFSMGCRADQRLFHLDSSCRVCSHCTQTRTEHTKPPSGKHSSWTPSDAKSPGFNINAERNFPRWTQVSGRWSRDCWFRMGRRCFHVLLRLLQEQEQEAHCLTSCTASKGLWEKRKKKKSPGAENVITRTWKWGKDQIKAGSLRHKYKWMTGCKSLVAASLKKKGKRDPLDIKVEVENSKMRQVAQRWNPRLSRSPWGSKKAWSWWQRCAGLRLPVSHSAPETGVVTTPT